MRIDPEAADTDRHQPLQTHAPSLELSELKRRRSTSAALLLLARKEWSFSCEVGLLAPGYTRFGRVFYFPAAFPPYAVAVTSRL